MDKAALIKELQKDWKKYWYVELFNKEGFERRLCEKCHRYFWTVDAERTACNEAPCEPYGFIGKRKKDWDYYELWKAVERFFVKNGHASVPRYPTVCRWRPDLYFTIASIINFQRVGPEGIEFFLPANPLIVPQVCFRFGDIPNIGVTGRHHSSFIMIGQHAFKEGGYWKDETIRLDYEVCTKVLGIRPEDLVFKEDAWAGGGAGGYSLEYHTQGLELGNAVFTEFRDVNGKLGTLPKPVVDMGAGFERWLWYLQGTSTSYDSAFAGIMKKAKAGVDYDQKLFTEYSKIAGALNFDEVADVRKAREGIAKQLGVGVDELKKKIEAMQAVYAVADHAKTLLIALNDGGLPTNTAGGYNLRVILRRALSLIEEYKLGYELVDVMEWHRADLKKMHPELVVDARVRDIVENDVRKYKETKANVTRRIDQLLSKKQKINDELLIQLYDSEGITPELIEEEARKKDVTVEVPADFYARVTERHMESTPVKKAARFDTRGLEKTQQLCYDDIFEHDAEVMEKQGEWVILDSTAFYPEGGGQAADRGTISGVEVEDVQKENGIVFHKVAKPAALTKGDKVRVSVDRPRRLQLMQHHDATHILHGCAHKLLGEHVWQHSALKETDHARLDITHYKPLTEKELGELEKCANAVVKKGLPTKKSVHSQHEAESLYGFQIYQGGVPSGNLRIVNIVGHDIEACGGTHSDNVATCGRIVITGQERVQDGVIRLNFLAGNAAKEYEEKCEAVVREASTLLNSKPADLEKNVKRLLEEHKAARKEAERALEEKAQQASASLTFEKKGDFRLVITRIKGADATTLQKISLEGSAPDTLIFLFGEGCVFASAGETAARDYHVGRLLKEMFAAVGGKGGGTPVLAQGIIPNENIEKAIQWLRQRLV